MTDDLLHHAIIDGGIKAARIYLLAGEVRTALLILKVTAHMLTMKGWTCSMCAVPLAPGHISEGTSHSPRMRWLFCSQTCRDTWHGGLGETARGIDERERI